MPPIGRVIPWLVLGFALVGLVLGLYEWSNPPFTDERIRESLTDTWEVATSTTRVFGVVFLGLGAICVVLARSALRAGNGVLMIVAYAAAIACLATLMVFIRNHIELTQRAAGLTGEDFGAFFGLL